MLREAAKEMKSGYFLCSLRSLRWYRRVTMMPMIPMTPKVVNAISMSAIVNYLHSINKESHYKKYTCYYNPYPKAVLGELIRYQVTYNHKSHDQLAYIIAILGEVVYLRKEKL